MTMLRWMCVVTKLGKIINEITRGTTKVEEIAKKVQERRSVDNTIIAWGSMVLKRTPIDNDELAIKHI